MSLSGPGASILSMGEAAREPKTMRLRYQGVCRLCGATLGKGVRAWYEPATKTVRCLEHEPDATPDAERAVHSTPASSTAPPPTVSMPSPSVDGAQSVAAHEPWPMIQPEDAFVTGEAGASARREYERRMARREDRVTKAHPHVGKLLLAVFSEGQSTHAWVTGAVGEEVVGQSLAKLASPQLRVINDRRIPKSRANIDHVVVTPAGIFVIDAKHYEGQPRREVFGGLFTPRWETLYVGRRDCGKLLESMAKQRDVVASLVPDVPVHPMLCFVEAEWGLFQKPFTVRDVFVTHPRGMRERLAASNEGPTDVAQVTAALCEQLRPA